MLVLKSKRLRAGWWTLLRARPRTSSTSEAPLGASACLAEAWPPSCCTAVQSRVRAAMRAGVSRCTFLSPSTTAGSRLPNGWPVVQLLFTQ